MKIVQISQMQEYPAAAPTPTKSVAEATVAFVAVTLTSPIKTTEDVAVSLITTESVEDATPAQAESIVFTVPDVDITTTTKIVTITEHIPTYTVKTKSINYSNIYFTKASLMDNLIMGRGMIDEEY